MTDHSDKKWRIGININTVEPITEAGFAAYVGQIRLFDPADHRKDMSFCAGIDLSYQLKGNWAARLSGKMTNYDISETWNVQDMVPFNASEPANDEGSIRESVTRISPGILWNMPVKKINIYGGFQLSYTQYGEVATHLRYYHYDNNALMTIIDYNFKNDGGFSLGIGPVAGFRINLWRYISAGAEFSSAFSYIKTGGLINEEESFTYVNPYNAPFTEKSSMQSTFEGCKYSGILSSLEISAKF